MNRVVTIASIFALVLIGTLAGCGGSQSSGVNRAERQKIVDNFEEKLGQLDRKVQEGEAKLATLKAEAKVKLEAELVILKQKQASVRENLVQLKNKIADTSSDAWQTAKDKLDDTWQDITSKLQQWLDAIK